MRIKWDISISNKTFQNQPAVKASEFDSNTSTVAVGIWSYDCKGTHSLSRWFEVNDKTKCSKDPATGGL